MLAVRAPVAALEQLLATVVAGLGSVESTLCASLNASGVLVRVWWDGRGECACRNNQKVYASIWQDVPVYAIFR